MSGHLRKHVVGRHVICGPLIGVDLRTLFSCSCVNYGNRVVFYLVLPPSKITAGLMKLELAQTSAVHENSI